MVPNIHKKENGCCECDLRLIVPSDIASWKGFQAILKRIEVGQGFCLYLARKVNREWNENLREKGEGPQKMARGGVALSPTQVGLLGKKIHIQLIAINADEIFTISP